MPPCERCRKRHVPPSSPLLLLLLLILPACKSAHKPEIAVIPKATAHLFWQSVQAGANAAAGELNVEVLWHGPPLETDYSRQIQIVDSMIARRVAGLAVAATDRTVLNASLERAARAGIPVTIFDSGVDSTRYMTFVATDNYEAGQLAARKLAELIGGKGKIGVVLHAPGSYSSMERERGFEDAMAREFPKIAIVARQFSMSDRSKGMAVAENMLTAHSDLAGIFASAEPGSVGTALAVKARGAAGRVKFVAFDASEGLVEDLRGGAIDALVAQDPFRIGYEAVKTLVDKLHGRTPPRRMDLHARVVTRADLERPEVKRLLFPDFRKYLH